MWFSFKNEETVGQFVTALVKLSKDLSFDGWLINIENKLSPEQIPLLVKMLRDLTGDINGFSSLMFIWNKFNNFLIKKEYLSFTI